MLSNWQLCLAARFTTTDEATLFGLAFESAVNNEEPYSPSYINIISLYCASGYIREISVVFIPAEIIQLCALFYGLEVWSKLYKQPSIKNYNDFVITTSDGIPRTILGFHSLRIGIHTWKFELMTKDDRTMIGITAMNVKDFPRIIMSDASDLRESAVFQVTLGQSFDSMNGESPEEGLLVRYGRKCEKKDVIEMRLNLYDGTLRFSINDEDQGILSDRMKGKDCYRLAVSFRCSGYESYKASCIRLISFDTELINCV